MKNKTFYTIYYNLELDIKAIKIKIASLERDKNRIINQSSPGDVKAISYDHQPSGMVVNEIDQLQELFKITTELSLYETKLKEKQQDYNKLCLTVEEVYKKSNDREMLVFKRHWLEFKSAVEIADELYLAKGTIDNIFTTINKKLRGE